MVNYEIKSQLAKLLATEDLIVENQNVETAQFNVQTRVLTLPRWTNASEAVYDLLVGHEVGHALFTPDCEWFDKYPGLPQSIINVVEDARIEKMMKRKYPGLLKTFFKGYKELNDEDFFELADKDINTFNLADKTNLFFKSGNHIDISFTSEEQVIVDMVAACETFGDVLEASNALHEFCKSERDRQNKEQLEKTPEISLKGEAQQGDTSDTSEEASEDTGEAPSLSGQGESDDVSGDENTSEQPVELHSQKTNGYGKGAASYGSDIEAITDELFNEKVGELNDSHTGDMRDNLYAEVPKVDLKEYIISNEQVTKELHDHFNQEDIDRFDEEMLGKIGYYPETYFGLKYVDNEYAKFKKSAQKGVNFLVKEFEMKKSADAYARTSISKTGVLDTSKLHTYKFNEDIFKKINIVPDGKNHGLIFILDWSGSMSRCLLNTVKQLLELVWFCQKVQIPFDVYAFSTQYNANGYYRYNLNEDSKVGDLVVSGDFSLLHFLSSSVKKKNMDSQLLNLWRLSYTLSNRGAQYKYPEKYWMGGTPLNETFVCLHQMIPQFKKDNNVQKVHCVTLTDGEANCIPVVNEFKNHDGETRKGTTHLGYNSFLRNRKTGYTYKLSASYEYWKFTETMIKDLRQTFPDVNFIGIRIADKREFGYFARKFGATELDMKNARKNGSYSIKNAGYHTYFAISDSSLAVDDEFEVKEDATKTEIKRAFVKSLRAKKLNKKVLGEFVSLVA
ncbi:peptidase [Prochlorococcus phage P-TIM68]|uniref:Putative peptidase n=1 Tax=Prochlorococcus phage P-TIM68 TaxID=1542477 RepID=A0A0K0KVT9_9CAUD|nr:peptidase [Prochlorococcus phage P-TIM68]AIR93458.1 putative peptidase [Prochlorococcus phage P-TIM68]